jgi:hypothetical protein
MAVLPRDEVNKIKEMKKKDTALISFPFPSCWLEPGFADRKSLPGSEPTLGKEISARHISEASVRLGHKSLRTLMKRSSSWYLPGDLFID